MDVNYMQYALRLGRRNLGQTDANPSVGCVIVHGDAVVGIGTTSIGGRPHAEVNAINMAGSFAHGADMYVTLEPCSHTGKTPPCTDAIITAGIKRVFIGAIDTNPKVNGQGIAMLKAAGIEVVSGILEQQARQKMAGFFSCIEHSRPYVTLKIATDVNNDIAKGNGQPVWVTSKLARAYAHKLRSQHDCLLTSAKTVVEDNPKLNVRLPGLEGKSPDIAIIGGEDYNTTSEYHDILMYKYFYKKQCFMEVLADLKLKNYTNILVEAGLSLATSFIKQGLVDKLIWIKSKHVSNASNKVKFVPDLYRFKLCNTMQLPEDIIYTYSNAYR